MSNNNDLKKTVFHDLHLSQGAKMVPFAGYEMPLQYEMGIKQEHLHCREKAGLFDVSHMGQAELITNDYISAAFALETLVPGDVIKLKPRRMRYSVLLNEAGGIEDDLMITHRVRADGSSVVGLVVNAACKTQDYAYISSFLPDNVELKILEELSLLALQGPMAGKILSHWCPDSVGMAYMTEIETSFSGIACRVARCGYTGEDGFELSIPNEDAAQVAEMLLSHTDVEMIGLGARDSLRLEAGFCLYGHDIDTKTSPIEADLGWIMNKRRREEGGFLGEERIMSELNDGASKRRIGLLPQGTAAPAREGAVIFDENDNKIGAITSGGFGPTVGGPVAMGYVTLKQSQLGHVVFVEVRGKKHPWRVTDMPFTPYRTYKAKKPTQH